MRASLLQAGAELEERDFFADRLSEPELRELLAGRSAADFFSWNSPSFKRMGLTRECLDDDRLVAMMVEEPRLIRRPLLAVGEELLVGTDRTAMERVVP